MKNKKPSSPLIETLKASIPLLLAALAITGFSIYLIVKLAPQVFQSIPLNLEGFMIPFTSIIIFSIIAGFIQRFFKIYAVKRKEYKTQKKILRKNKRR